MCRIRIGRRPAETCLNRRCPVSLLGCESVSAEPQTPLGAAYVSPVVHTLQGLGFRVQGLGFRVEGLGFRFICPDQDPGHFAQARRHSAGRNGLPREELAGI